MNIKQVLCEGRHARVGGRSGRTLTGLAHRAGASALASVDPRDDEEATVEALNPAKMTCDSSVALAQVVRTQPPGVDGTLGAQRMNDAKALIRFTAYVETSANNRKNLGESPRGPMSSGGGAP